MTLHPWTASEPWPYDARDLLIVGPPGTGKTHTLLTHYVWPVIEAGRPVLAVSFTRAAARVLRQRTAERFGGSPEDYRRSLSTIHSEAWWRVGGGRAHDDDEDAAEDLWASVYEAERDEVDRYWGLTRAMYPADVALPPRERLRKVCPGHRLDHVASVVEHRRARIDRRQDYTDLLEAALIDGRHRPLALLAIDEANDLSALQLALIRRWATDAERVVMVGDPDQTIYRWAGASHRHLERRITLGRDDPVARPVRYLPRSHRVPRSTHAWARSIIARVGDRTDAPYLPADRDGSLATTTPTDAIREAVEYATRGLTVMFLSRTRSGCVRIGRELDAALVPHTGERCQSRYTALWDVSRTTPPDVPADTTDAARAILERLGNDCVQRVVVTTVHGAKGRQADLVVIDARSGTGKRGLGKPHHADDERRLAYVAATRGIDRTLVIPAVRPGWLEATGSHRRGFLPSRVHETSSSDGDVDK